MAKLEEVELLKLQQVFLSNLKQEVTELQALVGAEDWAEVAQKANRAAGDAGLCGFSELLSAMRRLEQAGHQSNEDEAQCSLQALSDALFQLT